MQTANACLSPIGDGRALAVSRLHPGWSLGIVANAPLKGFQSTGTPIPHRQGTGCRWLDQGWAGVGGTLSLRLNANCQLKIRSVVSPPNGRTSMANYKLQLPT